MRLRSIPTILGDSIAHEAEHFLRYRLGFAEGIEILLMFMCIAIVFMFPDALGWRRKDLISTFINRFASNYIVSITILIAASIALRAIYWPVMGMPQPIVADETSILLQSALYSSGHIAADYGLSPNFQSIYAIMAPKYASMYPPLRALPMFAGRSLGLGEWGGVWAFSTALVIACYLMLRRYISASIAFTVSFVIIVRLGIFSFWINSFFGAELPALGGVLAVLGVKLASEKLNYWSSAAFGLGAALLLTTRPYEGALLVTPLGVAYLIYMFRQPRDPKTIAAALMLASTPILAGLALIVTSNITITGNWKSFAYNYYRQLYGGQPALLFQHAAAPVSQKYGFFTHWLALESREFKESRSFVKLMTSELLRLFNYWNFYVGSALLIPFALGLAQLRKHAALMTAGAVLLAGLLLETWNHSIYASPIFGIVILTIGFGFDRLRQIRLRDKPVGIALARGVVIVVCLGVVYPTFIALRGHESGNPTPFSDVNSYCCWIHPKSLHVAIDDYLHHRTRSNSIVFVDSSEQAPIYDVVYNGANLANQSVVWANSDLTYNADVARRFPGRALWLLTWKNDEPCLKALGSGSRSCEDLRSVIPNPHWQFIF